ncbi:MAG: hypothetical protein M5U28_36540 [Sandaracinaceae bacterium]|nr:hypothetical protein [Sandaracinaceae bacterium]
MLLRILGVLASLTALSACCNTRCQPHDVYVVVSADGASVTGVTIEGADFRLHRAGGRHGVRPERRDRGRGLRARGERPGYDPVPVELEVRTIQPPAFSCECRRPIGGATVELGEGEPEPDPDAGPEPEPDAG